MQLVHAHILWPIMIRYLLLVLAFVISGCDRRPNISAKTQDDQRAHDLAVDKLLRGNREAWSLADSAMQYSAVEKVVRETHPELEQGAVIQRVGSICGRLDVSFERRTLQESIKWIEEAAKRSEEKTVSN